MSTYRWSICEPDNPVVIEKGLIRKEEIMETFEQFPWIDRLRKIATMKGSDVCFSPSLEFENNDTRQGVTFSIVGTETEYEFYIFYERHADNLLFDMTGQTKDDAVKFLDAFLDNDTAYLEKKIKNA